MKVHVSFDNAYFGARGVELLWFKRFLLGSSICMTVQTTGTFVTLGNESCLMHIDMSTILELG